MKIDQYEIGLTHQPFVIAEMSGNHNQSLQRALEIVEAAAKSGAHAVKLQTYTAETMTLDLKEGEFFIKDPNSLWNGTSLFELYGQAHTPWEWHVPIMQRAKELGLACFSTPFDSTAVAFLEGLNAPCYKIASFENTDLPLIRQVAKTGKPMIISTGMATLAEIDEAVRAARAEGCKDLILLKCTSSYPAHPASSNLASIPHMRAMFGCEVGLSDHTLGIGAAIASVALGATVIEKHVTINRAEGGVDSAFSLEPDELKQLVQGTLTAWQAIGSLQFGPSNEEAGSLVFRRSLYICENMKAGDALTPGNLRAIRPGHGLPPKYIDRVMGKRVNRALKKGTALRWEFLLDGTQ